MEEEAVGFRRPVDLTTSSRFRRIAGIGPVYEVLSIQGEVVRARKVDEDDVFEFALADVESDPVA
ncbi:hypothetical protein BZG35_13800 [Brevundimonas sp. LM2]|uniref:hypothetical protein n=1 Tax=Brevundimonas sp. LM2 TaxID=1938605 RepID=UPI000983A621|nr:hypothetical protein [Brevundimonas sp. LM2]AQR62600.1 hypothetical protein BZG35_13800 [Brevundimonas sp. LM2]